MPLVGPMDLPTSMDLTGERNNPELQAILQVPKRAASTGNIIGTTLAIPDKIRQKIE